MRAGEPSRPEKKGVPARPEGSGLAMRPLGEPIMGLPMGELLALRWPKAWFANQNGRCQARGTQQPGLPLMPFCRLPNRHAARAHIQHSAAH